MYNRTLHDYIPISIPVPLGFGQLCNWKTSQPYGLELLTNLQSLHFRRPEKVTELAKKVK